MVLDYYPLIDNEGNVTEFAEVEALDDVKTNDGKKFCTKKLKIGAKLSLWQFIKASFDVAYQNIKSQVEVSESTRFAGDNNAKLIGGGCAKLAGGKYAKLIGGDCATLAGGAWAKLIGGDDTDLAGGDCAKIVGGNGVTLAGGYDAIIVGDNGSVAKGKKGSIIVLVERNDNMNIVNFKAVQVDGEEIKEDVLYKLENGEFVEVE